MHSPRRSNYKEGTDSRKEVEKKSCFELFYITDMYVNHSLYTLNFFSEILPKLQLCYRDFLSFGRSGSIKGVMLSGGSVFA